jgi:peptidoglycan-associated lipoprotein
MQNTRFFPFLIFFLFSTLFLACSYTEKVRDGRTAFDRKQYKVALPMLEKEFNRAKTKKEKGILAFEIGESYQKTGQNQSAILWYRSAYDNGYGVEALRMLAQALKKDEQYGEALKIFKEAGIELGSPFEFKKDIEACQLAMKWKTARSPYEIEKQNFNSAADDYSPAFYAADQLVFTSDRPNSINDAKYKWTGRAFSDFYLTDKNGNAARPFNLQINTDLNEGSATFNGNFTTLIFVKNLAGGKYDDQYTKLFSSRREAAVWETPTMLPFCKEGVHYWQPTLSPDGNQLIFSALDENGGFGGFDLYLTNRDKNGEWAEPKLLPRNINTVGNEVFPNFHNDTLYFSSDFHQGMGGLDIFKTYPLNDFAWSSPQNLRSPINSSNDDFSLIIENNFSTEKNILQKGFFSSNRKGGQGGDDIYAFKKIILPPLPVDTTKKKEEKPPAQIVYKYLLEGYVVEKILADASNPNSKVLGRKGISTAAVAVSTGKEPTKIVTNEEGFFSLEVVENTDYQLLGSKENYLNNKIFFSTKGIVKDANSPTQKFEVEILLDKIYKNKEIVLDNIYYDYDKWDIRIDAQPTLDALARTLIENPKINIELNSHTDCRGNDNYNQELSQRRAQAAVDYLITKGIGSNRLTPRGYGESQPANACVCNKCTETEHQQNRRTTFKIVE